MSFNMRSVAKALYLFAFVCMFFGHTHHFVDLRTFISVAQAEERQTPPLRDAEGNSDRKEKEAKKPAEKTTTKGPLAGACGRDTDEGRECICDECT